jgi:uncharacterized protein YdhG (YjbR/CyaY superfamily)
MDKTKFKTVDEYISAFPPNVKVLLRTLRKTIKQAAPKAEEVISYNMPAFKCYGRILVYFVAHTKHVELYPGHSMVNKVFKDDLIALRNFKGHS